MSEAEILGKLLREQIERNSEIHAMLKSVMADLERAREERNQAWAELALIRKQNAVKQEKKHEHNER